MVGACFGLVWDIHRVPRLGSTSSHSGSCLAIFSILPPPVLLLLDLNSRQWVK